MKKSILIVLTILLIHTTLIGGYTGLTPPEPQTDFPEKVSQILTNSCYDCHATGSNAEKAVKAMDLKKWEEYKLTKKISLLTKICEVVEGADMPPEKFLKQHPEKALSASDIRTICNWTSKETEKLVE